MLLPDDQGHSVFQVEVCPGSYYTFAQERSSHPIHAVCRPLCPGLSVGPVLKNSLHPMLYFAPLPHGSLAGDPPECCDYVFDSCAGGRLLSSVHDRPPPWSLCRPV